MTCLEAQSKIVAYIEQKIDRSTKQDFLNHVCHCTDCREELNIYYTMIEGVRQLDANEPLSKDFDADLDKRINQELEHRRTKDQVVFGSILLMVIGVISFGIVGYINFLRLLEQDEETKKKEAQGEYYYSTNFDDVLFRPYDNMILFDIGPKEEPEETFYQKIRTYQNFQKVEIDEDEKDVK